MYIKENQALKCKFTLVKAKQHLGGNVLHYQAREEGFWAALKAWELTPKASPSPILVFQAKGGVSSTKIAEFIDFSKI